MMVNEWISPDIARTGAVTFLSIMKPVLPAPRAGVIKAHGMRRAGFQSRDPIPDLRFCLPY